MLTGAVCALLLSSNGLTAQQVSPRSDLVENETVVLSPFAIEAANDLARYQATEATSGTRVRIDLMEATQSISVVTRELIDDISTDRLLDAAKYVSGITEGTLPNLQDRMTIRGFQADGATLDGFFIPFVFSSQDPVIIERMEIVKGPNAIIAPAGLPGGVVNNVTKKPLFTNKGYLSYQAGRYSSNRFELDTNYVVVPDKIAVRVVGAFQDADEYGRDNFRQTWTIMPMVTYRISPTTEATIQFHGYNWTAMAPTSVPISPYAVGAENVRLLDGLPRDFVIDSRQTTRHSSGQHARLFLTSQITDNLSMRISGNYSEIDTKATYIVFSAPNYEVISRDPITGQWSWDGVTRNDNPLYTTDGGRGAFHRTLGNFQNDFAYEIEGQGWKSKTVAGYAINFRGRYPRREGLFVPNPTVYDIVAGYTPPPIQMRPERFSRTTSRQNEQQYYIYQVLSLFDEKLILSGSLSHNEYTSAVNRHTAGVRSRDEISVTHPAAGIVYKITPEVSVYYGYSEQGVPDGPNVNEQVPYHLEKSNQHELGVRVRLFDGKLYATLSYFDIEQNDIANGDSRNYIAPIPDPLFPAVMTDRTAKGVEFEFNWSPTSQVSVVGNIQHSKNRDAEDMQFVNSPDDTAAIWGSYEFSDSGPLRGLRIGLGADYIGKRAGDTYGWTTPPIGFMPVRIQPSFYLPARTLINASATYRFNKNWRAQLNINNLTDKDYIMASFNRGVYMGVPINTKLAIRYDF